MDESLVSNSEDYPTAESDLGRDRLSELPNSLALEILSLLEMKDVVRTTVLSKRWKDLWTTVPCLDFTDSYRSLVDGALAKWNGDKILKFRIDFWGDEDDPPTSDVLDSWLLIPFDKQVEDLFICMDAHMEPQYCVSQRLYSCSSFTNLSLSYCDVKIEENVNVQWHHLKSLKIEQPSCLSADDMNRIISGAPLLEELMLLSLGITDNFNIESTSLKMLKIGRDDASCISSEVMANAILRIWCPNLLSLEISGCVYGTCLLDVPSLTNAIIHLKESCEINIFRRINEDFPPLEMFNQLFRSIRHVEKLTLSGLSIQLLLEMKEDDMVIQFSNTKFLKVYAAEAMGMLDVLGMFPELVILVIKLEKDRYHILDEDPHVAAVDAFYSLACYLLASEMTFPSPSLFQLKTVEITWSIREASIFPMVEILLENAVVLEKMVLRLRNCGYNRKTFISAKKKVLSMPRSSPTAQVIISKQW